MARRWQVPSGVLISVICIGTSVYVGCCLLAIPFVDEMRNFPEPSRRTMVALLLAFAAGAACLGVFMLRRRRWAAWIATAVGVVGVLLFAPGALSDGKGDPEWFDAGAAMVSAAIRVATGCVALTVAAIAGHMLSLGQSHSRPLGREAHST